MRRRGDRIRGRRGYGRVVFVPCLLHAAYRYWLLGASAAAPPHMWKEQASPRVSCSPPGETVGRRDRPRSGAVCPFVRLVSGGGDHIPGARLRPDPVWQTACFSVPPAPTAVLHLFPTPGGCHDTPQRLLP